MDASERDIPVILSYEVYPIIYLSRRFISAETNYSNIKNSVLAIVWNTNRACQFLLGRKFLLNSDHNLISERMMQMVKMRLNAFSSSKNAIVTLTYRIIPHASKMKSPSALNGRQIRLPITMSYSTNAKNVVQKRQNQFLKKITLLYKMGIIQL